MSAAPAIDKHGDPVGEPKFTRRHWAREARSAYLDLTGPLRGASRKYSQFRIVVALFAVAFIRGWPTTWGWPEVVALAVLVVALPLDALFSRVPVAEALAALQAVLTSVAGNAMAKVGGVVTHRKKTAEESTTVEPAAASAIPDADLP